LRWRGEPAQGDGLRTLRTSKTQFAVEMRGIDWVKDEAICS
jgi:hypothetical protein